MLQLYRYEQSERFTEISVSQLSLTLQINVNSSSGESDDSLIYMYTDLSRGEIDFPILDV
jgi:hypothetical protein